MLPPGIDPVLSARSPAAGGTQLAFPPPAPPRCWATQPTGGAAATAQDLVRLPPTSSGVLTMAAAVASNYLFPTSRGASGQPPAAQSPPSRHCAHAVAYHPAPAAPGGRLRCDRQKLPPVVDPVLSSRSPAAGGVQLAFPPPGAQLILGADAHRSARKPLPPAPQLSAAPPWAAVQCKAPSGPPPSPHVPVRGLAAAAPPAKLPPEPAKEAGPRLPHGQRPLVVPNAFRPRRRHLAQPYSASGLAKPRSLQLPLLSRSRKAQIVAGRQPPSP